MSGPFPRCLISKMVGNVVHLHQKLSDEEDNYSHKISTDLQRK